MRLPEVWEELEIPKSTIYCYTAIIWLRVHYGISIFVYYNPQILTWNTQSFQSVHLSSCIRQKGEMQLFHFCSGITWNSWPYLFCICFRNRVGFCTLWLLSSIPAVKSKRSPFNWVAKNLSSKWKRQPGFSLICKDQVMESLLDLIGPHWLMLMRFLVDPLCPPELQVLDELHVWSSIKDVLRCSEGWWWLDELQHFFFFTSLKGAQVFFPYCHSYFHWC